MENKLKLIAGVDRLGKSMHGLAIATNFAARSAKKAKKLLLDDLRENQIEYLKDFIFGKIMEKDPELLCSGCELEGTFCEGRRCEDMAEMFFEERDEPREYWRRLYVKFYGKRYYNLSLRKKLRLINP